MTTLDSFSNIQSPVYVDNTGNLIDIIVDIDGLGSAMPFTASANDSTDYGRQLFQNAVSGIYGPVGPYVPPPVSLEQLQVHARLVRNSFIDATDRMTITDYTICDEYLTTGQREELFATRLNFRQWPAQPGWPQIPLPAVPQWISYELSTHGYVLPAWQY